MAEPFLGQLMCVGFNFAPRGWALCQGQLLQISTNTALFSLLGTMYGGDGRTTFGLPDLRGRVSLSFGQGPGLQNYDQGQAGGVETVTLITSQIPAHNHSVGCNGGDANDASPANAFPATGSYNTAPNATMNPNMIGMTGGGQPHENREPFLVLNWIIALQGIFPSRN